MPDELKELLEKAKKVEQTAADREEQRQSLAFGNANIENPRITREMVAQEARNLKK